VAGDGGNGGGGVIKYTLDGSDPTAPAAMTYAKPIMLKATTVVRAVKAGPDVLQSRNVTFTKKQ
jgi:hypothetical protein